SSGAVLAAVITVGGSANAAAQSRGPEDVGTPVGEEQPRQPQDSIENIFKQVFGKERPVLGRDEYSVLIEGINVGEYDVTPDNDATLGSVDANFVTTVLAPLLVEDSADSLKALGAGQDNIRFEQLRELGMNVEFDSVQLVLRIDIPAAIRTVRNLNLRSLRNRSEIELVEQSEFSAYASVRAGTTIVEDSGFSGTGFTRFAADIDLAVNVHGIAAEV